MTDPAAHRGSRNFRSAHPAPSCVPASLCTAHPTHSCPLQHGDARDGQEGDPRRARQGDPHHPGRQVAEAQRVGEEGEDGGGGRGGGRHGLSTQEGLSPKSLIALALSRTHAYPPVRAQVWAAEAEKDKKRYEAETAAKK